jgi:hypothetical protein
MLALRILQAGLPRRSHCDPVFAGHAEHLTNIRLKPTRLLPGMAFSLFAKLPSCPGYFAQETP